MALFPAVYSRTVLTWSLAELGHFAEAADVGREAIRIAETVDHPYTLAFACLGLGTVHLRRGDFPEAITHLERAVRTCRTGDVPVIFALAASPLGSAYCLTDKAEAAYREALDMANEMGMRPLEARCRLGLGVLYQQAARTEEARAEVAAAIGEFRALGMQTWLARAESAGASPSADTPCSRPGDNPDR
jgi:Flp pilus assembly protein TadD